MRKFRRKIIVDIIESDDPRETGFIFAPEDPLDTEPPTAPEIMDAISDVLVSMQGYLPRIERKTDA